MKILHLNDHLASVGGVETYLLALVPLLEDSAKETHVSFATGEEGLFAREYRIRALNSIQFRDVEPCRIEVRRLLERAGYSGAKPTNKPRRLPCTMRTKTRIAFDTRMRYRFWPAGDAIREIPDEYQSVSKCVPKKAW